MAAEQFVVSQVNPNNSVGGGGCVCDEEMQTDCKPPYIVFSHTMMDSVISPHTVMCANCVRIASEKLANDEQLMVGFAGDEPTPVAATDDEVEPEI